MTRDHAYEGGCACRATRYRAAGVATNLCFCHCRSCRMAGGAPLVAWATFDAARFEVTAGRLGEYVSSRPVVRGFCPRCGTALSYRHRDRPNEVDVAIATLDDPAALAPECHIYVSEKLPWVRLGDGLPQHAQGSSEGS